jgi:hypothetical protein
MRKKNPANALRSKLNLTMHPEVREWADIIAFRRRRSISQLFEDLVEAEWRRQNQPKTKNGTAPAPAAPPPTPRSLPEQATTAFHQAHPPHSAAYPYRSTPGF